MKAITRIPLKNGYSKGDRCMNLTELQIQLRSIEEHISDLQTEIEKTKPQPEDEKKAMFEKITELASKYPLESRRFPKSSNVDVKSYISCLAYISLADDSKIYDKLLYLCRLSHGMGLPVPSEDIFRMGLEIDEKYFDKACSKLKSQKYSFLADTLILVNITEEATEASFRLIADIAKIFECEKEDLRAAAMVAKAVLMEDFNVLKQIPVPSRNRWMGQFKEHIPAAWIKAQRIKCGQLCTEIKKNSSTFSNFYNPLKTVMEESGGETSFPCVIKNRLQAGTIVQVGDVLISYEESVRRMKTTHWYDVNYGTVKEQKTIAAPCDGVVFFIESNKKGSTAAQSEKYIEVYVVSYFDEYAAFSDWHKKK